MAITTELAKGVLSKKVADVVTELYPKTSADQVIISDGTNVQEFVDTVGEYFENAQATTYVVTDIAARDALSKLVVGDQVWVIDATGDTTVATGAAKYIVESLDDNNDPATPVFKKVAEAESMDVVVDWDDISNGPTSTPTEIDAAVTDAHTHSNSAVLDALGVDSNDKLTYSGTLVGGSGSGSEIIITDAITDTDDDGYYFVTSTPTP